MPEDISKKLKAVERQYFTMGELQELWDYLSAKGLQVYSGLDKMSPSDKFAYVMLKDMGFKYSKEIDKPYTVKPVLKVGSCSNGYIQVKYDEIVKAVGFEPNVTHLDDKSKVKASWGFKVDGDFCGIWCYKYYGNPRNCTEWSYYGNLETLRKLFPNI